jgi:hypothetical protein
MVVIFDMGVVFGIFNFILGIVFLVSAGALILTLAKDIVAHFRESNPQIDLPVEESILLAKRDFNFYIQIIMDIAVYMIVFSQISALMTLIGYGFNLLVLFWLENFVLLILVMFTHSYYLSKQLPTRLYDHIGSPKALVTLGMMIAVTISRQILVDYIVVHPLLVVLWLFFLSLTVYYMTVRTKSSELSYLLWTPIALFYSLSLLSYAHILQSIYLTIILSFMMSIQVALLLTNHLTEYPINMAYIGLMCGLLSTVIAILPIQLPIKLLFISMISFLGILLVNNMSWRRFRKEHLTHITSRNILYHLSISPEPCSMNDLKAISQIDKYDVEPTVNSLVTTGILRVTAKGQLRLYSIRSRIFVEKLQKFGQFPTSTSP